MARVQHEKIPICTRALRTYSREAHPHLLYDNFPKFAQQRDLKAAGMAKILSERTSSVAKRAKLTECLAYPPPTAADLAVRRWHQTE